MWFSGSLFSARFSAYSFITPPKHFRGGTGLCTNCCLGLWMFAWWMVAKLADCDLGCWCVVKQLFKCEFGMLIARPKTNWFDVNRLACWWPRLMNGFGGTRGRLVGAFFFSKASLAVGVCCIPSGSDRKICRWGGAGGIFLGWWFIDGAAMCGRISERGFIRGIPLIWFSFELSLAFGIWLNLGIVRMLTSLGWKILEWKTIFSNEEFDENSLQIACIPPRSTRHRWCAACKVCERFSLKFSSNGNSSLKFSMKLHNFQGRRNALYLLSGCSSTLLLSVAPFSLLFLMFCFGVRFRLNWTFRFSRFSMFVRF